MQYLIRLQLCWKRGQIRNASLCLYLHVALLCLYSRYTEACVIHMHVHTGSWHRRGCRCQHGSSAQGRKAAHPGSRHPCQRQPRGSSRPPWYPPGLGRLGSLPCALPGEEMQVRGNCPWQPRGPALLCGWPGAAGSCSRQPGLTVFPKGPLRDAFKKG